MSDPWAENKAKKEEIMAAIKTFKDLKPEDLEKFPVLKRIHELSNEFYKAQEKASNANAAEGEYEVARPLYHLFWPT